MQTHNIANATTITAGNFVSANDFTGLGLSLPFSRVCNDSDHNLVVTQDAGVTIGKIYDTHYFPLPNSSGMYSAYINSGATVTESAADGLAVTTANNVSLLAFNYGTLQATRSVINVSMLTMAFSVNASNTGYKPSSFMVTLTLGNVNSGTNVIGESLNWGFSIVGPSTTATNTYILPPNVNFMLSNFSSPSPDMSLNISIKGPTPPSGSGNYEIFLTEFLVVGLLDATAAGELNPTTTVTNLNAD